MSHLLSMRKGWTSERLAELTLSRLGFLARPTTTGDDIGVDFVCTLFEPRKDRDQTFLLPRASFAVQVKSSNRNISLTKHRNYLNQLELPFYVAVANTRQLKIDVYSGRCFPFALALRGPHVHSLTGKLVKSPNVLLKDSIEGGPKQVRVKMPLVTSITANASAKQLREATKRLGDDCLEAGLNIAHKRVGQFVFSGMGGTDRAVIAGPGSAQVFRQSFSDRVTEYCRNLAFLNVNRRQQPTTREIRAILRTMEGLKTYLPKSMLRNRAADRLREILNDRGA